MVMRRTKKPYVIFGLNKRSQITRKTTPSIMKARKIAKGFEEKGFTFVEIRKKGGATRFPIRPRRKR